MTGLKYILILENMTAKMLAKELNISTASISQWFAHIRNIPMSRIEQIHTLFPSYSTNYFDKEIGELDVLHLQKEHYLSQTDTKKRELLLQFLDYRITEEEIISTIKELLSLHQIRTKQDIDLLIEDIRHHLYVSIAED